MPDIGTGTHTLLRQIAAEVLTVPPELISNEIGDTESFESDAAPGGSKITNMSGHVVLQAAEQLRQRLTPVAASLLGCAVTDVVLQNGRFGSALNKKRWIEFGAVAQEATKPNGELRIRETFEVKGRSPVPAFVVQIAEVQVDVETGQLQVKRIVTAHDVGTVINPVAHQGQIEGGLVQGLGYATLEEVMTETRQSSHGEFRRLPHSVPAGFAGFGDGAHRGSNRARAICRQANRRERHYRHGSGDRQRFGGCRGREAV